MLADLDDLLDHAKRLDLETHLAGCDTCRAESKDLSTLTTRLQSEFHGLWDGQKGPSQTVMTKVRSQTHRITRSNKVNMTLRTLGGIAILLVLGLGLSAVISQLRNHTPAANGTAAPFGINMPVNSPDAGDRLLAFTMEKDRNLDIYTVRADGSGLTNLTNNPASDSNPFWSPDGKRIAFESDRTGDLQIYLMDADGRNITQITTGDTSHSLPINIDGVTNPWSPDGSKLLYWQGSMDETIMLYSVDINGENKTLLATGGVLASNISWSRDGQYIGYMQINSSDKAPVSQALGIYVVDADGSNLREMKDFIPLDENILTYRWDTEGQTIIFNAYKNFPHEETVYEFDPANDRLLRKTIRDERVLDWQDNVSLLLNVEESGTIFIWQNTNGSRKVLDWGAECSEFDFRRSARGNFVIGAYCPGDKSGLYWANADGSVIRKLPALSTQAVITGIGGLSWSNDEQYIAFNVQTSKSKNLYILHVGEPANATPTLNIETGPKNAVVSISPAWQPKIDQEIAENKSTPEPEKLSSPEGLIAFTSVSENGNLDIYTMRADGSELSNLTENPALDVNPFWSPDGKQIAFLSDRSGYTQVYTMNADGSDVFQVTDSETDHEFGDTTPWSPDGSTLLFMEKTSDDNQMIYTTQTNGSNRILHVGQPDHYSNVSWSPDGDHIAYIVLESVLERDMARIHVVDLRGNKTDITALLPEDEDLYISNYIWTDEGKIRFIAERIAWENDNGKFTVYEASLDGKTFVEIAQTSTPLVDEWQGTILVRGLTGETLTWLHADGTHSEFKPYENCQMDSELQYHSFSKRSSNGDLLFGAGCPNGDLWLYSANPDGTEPKQLLALPITTTDGGLNGIYWSPAGSYVAMDIVSSGVTYMYVLDVENSSMPAPLIVGAGDIHYNISWQPMP